MSASKRSLGSRRRTGATIKGYGFPWPATGIDGVEMQASAEQAMAGADYALLPIPRGVGGKLYVLDSESPIQVQRSLFTIMRQGAHVFCGRVTKEISAATEGTGITCHEYDPDRELMLERAAAIAEGALKEAFAGSAITINGASTAVVGYGNIGSVLTRRLLALGGMVTVAARNPVQRAAASADGARSADLDELAELAPSLSMVFSTVPAPVVDRHILERLPRGSLVLDIVPPPHRSDLESAERLGHRAIWARGLGRRAPVTVGASQWRGLMRRVEIIERGGKKSDSTEPSTH